MPLARAGSVAIDHLRRCRILLSKMKIGELADQVGCDVQTIRYYEREGLMVEPGRSEAGHRRYGEHDAKRLRFIRHCRSLDMPLSEIRLLLAFAAAPTEACAQVDALLDKHIAHVRARLAVLQDLDAQLVALRARCDGDTTHACAILGAFNDGPSRPEGECCSAGKSRH